MKVQLFILLIICQTALARQYQLKPIETHINASFRGLSVVNNKVAWVSGTYGFVGRTSDGGNTWSFSQVKGYERCDFRSIYAFNKRIAIIANAGVPAVILKTENGGKNWTLVYHDDDTTTFYDGIAFWNKREGMIYGDPVNGKPLLLLHTGNQGKTWEQLPDKAHFPQLADGEASFAASGTCIRIQKDGKLIIATGGIASHLSFSKDRGYTWKQVTTPILQGENSAGIFSFALNKYGNGIIVGGDYKRDTLSFHNSFYSEDSGLTWKTPQNSTRGYRECVEYLNAKTAVAVGPSGIDISYDGGINWAPFSNEKGFHVVRKSRKGTLTILAGAKGELSILK